MLAEAKIVSAAAGGALAPMAAAGIDLTTVLVGLIGLAGGSAAAAYITQRGTKDTVAVAAARDAAGFIREDLAYYRRELVDARADVAKLEERIEVFKTEVARRDDRIAELERKLADLEARVGGRRDGDPPAPALS